MELRVLNFCRGYVRIRISGSGCDRFFNLCAFHELLLWDLLPSGESYEACISRADFRKLRAIVRKSHVAVRIVRRYGLPFFLHKYRKRRVYVVGIAAALLFMAWLSSHIWNISIEGNLSQTDDVIFEYLETAGICHGMPKAGIDCRTLAAEIRNYFTQFSWVAAELKGTRLIIHVKEGITGEDEENFYPLGNVAEESGPTSLVATKSGTILSMYVRKGRPLAAIGDEVEKGTELVSGALPVYNDSQEIESWQYVDADADIVIRTQMSYRDVLSFAHTERSFTGKEKKQYLLRLGEMPFSLPFSFGSFETYTVLGRQTQLRLMENFYLPIYIEELTAKEYENRQVVYTKEEAREILRANLTYFMKNLEEKGVQIFENDVKIEWNEKSAVASGTLTVGEYAVRRTAGGQTEEESQENEYG